ncbi:MAG: CBS domain-containing protein [Bacteroidales bacterium]
MSAKDLISKEIYPLSPSTTIREALRFMDELKINALPLVRDDIYLSLLTEKELLDQTDAELPVASITGIPVAIREESHLFDALDRITQNDSDILPVIKDDSIYIGSISRQTILQQLALVCDASAPGAVILLEMPPQDYVLSDLARIAEQNNARIINVLTYPDTSTGMMRILVKVDQEDATYLLRSLERFNYHIIADYHHQSIADEMMKQRLDELLYYIEM